MIACRLGKVVYASRDQVGESECSEACDGKYMPIASANDTAMVSLDAHQNMIYHIRALIPCGLETVAFAFVVAYKPYSGAGCVFVSGLARPVQEIAGSGVAG